MVRVLPQPQRGEDRVAAVYHAVAIAAVCGIIIFRERQKTVFSPSRRRLWLWSEIPEQLSPTINCAVAIAVQGEPSVIRTSDGPRDTIWPPITVKVERY